MRKAYIILTHKDVNHLQRLVSRLDDGLSFFFIHVDLKSDFKPFQALLGFLPKVFMVKRVVTDWASFGLVKAPINAFEAIKSSKIDFDRISLLSGQDYPIKSNKKIDEFFSSSNQSVFMEYFTLPNYQRWLNGGLYRVNKYFFGLKLPYKYASKAANLTSTLIPVLSRKFPQHLKPYCGSQWWTIDMYALNYILNYLRENPKYMPFHRFTFAPDELFFQIILLNTKDERLKKSIENNNLRFTHWLRLDNPHPEILLKEDLGSIKDSEALFARKFDASVDKEILNMIDTECLNVDGKNN